MFLFLFFKEPARQDLLGWGLNFNPPRLLRKQILIPLDSSANES